ncbi:MAG TPA: hypothetical protein VFH47_07195 [Candidatus Thermoplasmatota archaeon]|nr:hypothetical protein [Candidatus Thermoplasmatota archaeon]
MTPGKPAPAGVGRGGGTPYVGMTGAPLVETRRLRTWESDAPFDPSRAWRILVRYHMLRLVRSWWLATLLVVILVYHVSSIGTLAYTFVGGGLSYHGVTAVTWMALAPGILLLLLVGAGSLSEDTRLRALLFYLSRPIDRSQYLRAKVTFLGLLLLGASLLPLALTWTLYLAYGWGTAAPSFWDSDDPASVAYWHATHLHTFGRSLASAMMSLLATFSIGAFLTTGILLASSLTQRAWHGAVAFAAGLAIWSVLALMMGEFGESSVYNLLYGPVGWFQLVTSTPYEAWMHEASAARWPMEGRSDTYRGWPGAVALAHVLLLASSTAFLAFTHRRVARQEADL